MMSGAKVPLVQNVTESKFVMLNSEHVYVHVCTTRTKVD